MSVSCVPALQRPEDPASRHIGQPAHPAHFWPQWLKEQRQGVPTIAEAELADHARLVVVAPHPDDELLMAAGLIQQQLQRGGALCVVCVTDGEACFGASAPKAQVAARRRAEHAAGLDALGAGGTTVHRLGLPDGAVAGEQQHLARLLRALLLPGDLVVSPWRLDGHPDHDATGRAAAQACAHHAARLLEAPVWMWHWAQPSHPAIDWRRLTRLSLNPMECERKWRALQCHASQLAPANSANAVVDESLQQRARWSFESFFTP